MIWTMSNASIWLSKTVYSDLFPRPEVFGDQAILLCDAVLARKVPGFSSWSKRFPLTLELKAGEKLKSLAEYERILKTIYRSKLGRAGLKRSQLTIVACGGGSVGDFAGFLASTLLRGVRLVHIPSTWLAAIDSSHGGKTALNFSGFKNQIGTFYPAQQIYLVRSLLESQGQERAAEARGEAVKTAILGGPVLMRKVQKLAAHSESLWPILGDLIQIKRAIVSEDLDETRGVRTMLNLGHTTGHVFESALGLPHGLAVGEGVKFALRWSYYRKLLSDSGFETLMDFAEESLPDIETTKIPSARWKSLLSADKKLGPASEISFVLVKGPGKVQIERVSLDEVVREAKRQGYCR